MAFIMTAIWVLNYRTRTVLFPHFGVRSFVALNFSARRW